MNILVCLSHVPDTTSNINFTPDGKEFDKTGIQFVINPNDEFGLTKSIILKEKYGGKVTVLNVGEISTEPSLRKALAIGADDAIRINLNPNDAFCVASQISAVIKKNSYDLIICGRESIDYNGGVVPGMIAELTNLPFINGCIGLDVNGKSATMIREIDGGQETLNASLPIVIGGQKGLVNENELRIPNMRGIMTARSKPLNVIEPIAQDIHTFSDSFSKLETKSECRFVNPENIDELISLLHNEAKVI